MRSQFFTILVLATTVATTTTDLLAQRGGGRGGRGGNNAFSRWRQPEEITNRIGLFFNDVPGPAEDGDKVADLATVETVRAATAANQLTVLYLVDQQDEEAEWARGVFEYMLGRDRELGIEMLAFHCGRIDLGKAPALKAKYEKERPLFVVFDEEGKATEVPMSGYRPAGSKLKKALEKAASGAMKPTLTRFAKDYGKIIEDYSELLQDRQDAETEMSKNRDDKSKVRKAEKELLKLMKDEAKLLEKEGELLAKFSFPERGTKRVGGIRPRRNRDGKGEDGGDDQGGGRRRGGGN